MKKIRLPGVNNEKSDGISSAEQMLKASCWTAGFGARRSEEPMDTSAPCLPPEDAPCQLFP